MRKLFPIKRWVDRIIANDSRGGVALIAVPVFLTAAAPGLLKVLAGTFAIGWAGFVFWRLWRAAKAAVILGDRAFDRETKHILSAEYHEAESATAAQQCL